MKACHCIQNNFPSPSSLHCMLSISNFDGPKYWSSLEIKHRNGKKKEVALNQI